MGFRAVGLGCGWGRSIFKISFLHGSISAFTRLDLTRLILGLWVPGRLWARTFDSSHLCAAAVEACEACDRAALFAGRPRPLSLARRWTAAKVSVSWGFRYWDKVWAAFWPGSRSQLPFASDRLVGRAVSQTAAQFQFRPQLPGRTLDLRCTSF